MKYTLFVGPLESEEMQSIHPHQLAECIIGRLQKLLIIDSRSFLEYNDGHVTQSINIGCSKLVKRRLISNKVTIHELIKGTMEDSLETDKIIVYDQETLDTDALSKDNFMYVVLNKLVKGFKDVCFLKGEFKTLKTIVFTHISMILDDCF